MTEELETLKKQVIVLLDNQEKLMKLVMKNIDTFNQLTTTIAIQNNNIDRILEINKSNQFTLEHNQSTIGNLMMDYFWVQTFLEFVYNVDFNNLDGTYLLFDREHRS